MTGPYWIKQWISSLSLLNEQFRKEDGSVNFEALGREEYAFRTAIITRKFEKSPRAKEVFEEALETYNKTTERARKGGLAKAENMRTGGVSVRRVGVASPAVRHIAAGAPVRLPSWPEFLQYVNANNIDYTDAREWFEMSIVDRDGKDREGNTIKNWKAALKAFCRSKEASRRKTA